MTDNDPRAHVPDQLRELAAASIHQEWHGDDACSLETCGFSCHHDAVVALAAVLPVLSEASATRPSR